MDGRQGYLHQGAFIIVPDPDCVLTYNYIGWGPFYVVLSVFLVNLDCAKVGTERRGSGRRMGQRAAAPRFLLVLALPRGPTADRDRTSLKGGAGCVPCEASELVNHG